MVPNLKHIGLNVKDLSKLSIKSDQMQKLSEHDRNKALNMLNKAYIQQNDERAIKSEVKLYNKRYSCPLYLFLYLFNNSLNT